MILKVAAQVNKSNKVYYCTKCLSNKKSYSKTVILPNTKFPLRLENKKLIERDEFIYNVADFENLYSWQRSHLSEPEFVLHDGPPYANGQPHMGHAINKILKDTILRYKILQGNKVHYIPGWDCHGLPIELKALTNSSEKGALEIRAKARSFAKKTVEKQKKVFKSWGVMGDWKNYYTTYDKSYIKTQLRQFFKMYKKNLIYRDYKPIFWSPSSRTALAEAELEYNENHKSPSAFIRFELKNVPRLQSLQNKLVYAIIWTTTPWTLPANLAISYNDSLSYSFVRKTDGADSNLYIVATDLIQNLTETLKCNFEIVETVKGDSLRGTTYVHPIYKDRENPFVHASHATGAKGTGLVHTAGAHGPDDFLVALNNKLTIEDLVNDNGCYNAKAGPDFEGKFVLTEGNKTVLEMINKDVIYLGEITHSYPYDWRTKKPVIIKASQQWFIDTNALRDKAIEALENVDILPNEKSLQKNLFNQLQKRPYWCISRQRTWGVPIPVFYDKNTSEIVINENTINHHCNLLETHGTDFWWTLSTENLLPENMHSSLNLNFLEKGQDIMDIWLDSGLSWAKVLEGTKVADLYLEGIDQFTGWFQSSLLTSVAIRDKAPYKSIYVHGFAVDENGNKMSKSLGNVVDPVAITNGKKGQLPYGVDTLRWWVACHANQCSQANVTLSVLQSSADEVQKVRSVLRFALSVLSDYKKSEEDSKSLLLIDRYILHVLYNFDTQISKFIASYQFHKVSFAVINLLTNSVSALYYTSIKDRLYCDNIDSYTRRGAQYTLLNLFEIVTKAVGPIVPHLVEEMYQYFPQKEQKTYFTSTHLKPEQEWLDVDLEKVMEVILDCRRDINKELTTNCIETEVKMVLSKQIFTLVQKCGKIDDWEQQLTDILQVSRVKLIEENMAEPYKLIYAKSERYPCPRCRKVQAEIQHELCKRCDVVINNILNDNKTAMSN